MRKRRIAAVLSTVAVLGFAGTAGAQADSVVQPGAGGVGAAGGGGVAGQQGGGALPFTGFQAAIALLGGAGIAATGFALRRLGRNSQS